MMKERILPLPRTTSGYNHKRRPEHREVRSVRRPIEALAFSDLLDLSEDEPLFPLKNHWLVAVVAALPDREVTRRMKLFRDSIGSIDDAVVEKVMMEAI